ncbi:unknown protein [Seminavis robusta]|uniref:Uncharacterized protein n=1 Tax=Seminavis robusta TaxID=568900 RepID=A0A9N8DE39_9STRA|nr:unknown protein [Seminavis robusta]|eukprot:Sro46_g027520.1 n/a (97) ;mRNA; f:100318-100608
MTGRGTKGGTTKKTGGGAGGVSQTEFNKFYDNATSDFTSLNGRCDALEERVNEMERLLKEASDKDVQLRQQFGQTIQQLETKLHAALCRIKDLSEG